MRLLLFAALGRCHDLACPSLVRGMVEKCTNVVNKERIEELCDLLLVCKVKGAVEWDPDLLLITEHAAD